MDNPSSQENETYNHNGTEEATGSITGNNTNQQECRGPNQTSNDDVVVINRSTEAGPSHSRSLRERFCQGPFQPNLEVNIYEPVS